MDPIPFKPMYATIKVDARWPLIVTPPHDARHKWRLTSETRDRRWFRCSACGKRKSQKHLIAMLASRMKEAERNMVDYLNADLWGRGTN